MPALSIQPPFPVFADTDGQPLENGYILIGQANLDPQGNPLAVYWDAALTIPAPQPIRTTGGYPSRSGTPANLYANADYSIRVLDKNGNLVYSANSVQQIISSGDVTFTQTGSTVERTVSQKLSDVYTFQDFGALGNNIDDDTLEMQAAIDYVASIGGGRLMGVPGSTYRISAPLVLKLGVQIDLAGTTIKQYTGNVPIVTAPSAALIANWSLCNGTLTHNTKQDGTSTIGVTVTGALNAGDIFVGLTSGATGKVVNVVAGTLTYLAGPGTLQSGESLSVNSATQATTNSVATMTKGGPGLRLADGAFSYNFVVDQLTVLDAYDGIVCPSTANTFAFVGRITNYVASVCRWAINYDCDSNIGANTNVVLENCWHVHSMVPAAPFSSGFFFNACAMFRWDSVLADKIEGQFLFIQTSSGEIGTVSLEASNLSAVASGEASAVQFSDSSLTVGTIKYVGNTFQSLNTITVTITGAIAVNDTIVGGTSAARGTVVSVAGNRVTFTQHTLDANFQNAESILVGGVSQGTVSAVVGNSGSLYLLRCTSSTRYAQFSAVVDNIITSGIVYRGQSIYDAAPTADNASPASGPYLVYNTQATLDRTSTGVVISGAIRVGDTITGATSGASGVVTAVGTLLVLYKPNNFIPWTAGENVQVGGVTQGTSLGPATYPGYLGDFATPPSVRQWNGVYRWLDVSGIGGTGARIVGDLTNSTIASRLMVQSSVLNGASDLAVIPNGTATIAALTVASNSNPTNASTGQLIASASAVTVAASRNGTGTFLPLQMRVNAADVRVQVDTTGSVRAGAPSLATSATDGFLYVPTCAGTPTGVPTVVTGYAPIVVNSTNNKLYFYSGGSWRDAGP
jgi:hypothetical protein